MKKVALGLTIIGSCLGIAGPTVTPTATVGSANRISRSMKSTYKEAAKTPTATAGSTEKNVKEAAKGIAAPNLKEGATTPTAGPVGTTIINSTKGNTFREAITPVMTPRVEPTAAPPDRFASRDRQDPAHIYRLRPTPTPRKK